MNNYLFVTSEICYSLYDFLKVKRLKQKKFFALSNLQRARSLCTIFDKEKSFEEKFVNSLRLET